jgi:hypothetical protein
VYVVVRDDRESQLINQDPSVSRIMDIALVDDGIRSPVNVYPLSSAGNLKPLNKNTFAPDIYRRVAGAPVDGCPPHTEVRASSVQSDPLLFISYQDVFIARAGDLNEITRRRAVNGSLHRLTWTRHVDRRSPRKGWKNNHLS